MYIFSVICSGKGAVTSSVLILLAGKVAGSQKRNYSSGEGDKRSRLVELDELGEVGERW
jgi:hypothetical protein